MTARRAVVALASALAAASLLGGCTDACRELADRTCARVGKTDPLCRELQAVAAAPRGEEPRACEAGVAFLDELERR